MKLFVPSLITIANITFLSILVSAGDLGRHENDIYYEGIARKPFPKKDPSNSVDSVSHKADDNGNNVYGLYQANDNYGAFGLYHYPVNGHHYPPTGNIYGPIVRNHFGGGRYNRVQLGNSYYLGDECGYGNDLYSYSGVPADYGSDLHLSHEDSINRGYYGLSNTPESPLLTKSSFPFLHQVYNGMENSAEQTEAVGISSPKAEERPKRNLRNRPENSDDKSTLNIRKLNFTNQMRFMFKDFDNSNLFGKAAFFGRGGMHVGATMWVAAKNGHIYLRGTANNMFLVQSEETLNNKKACISSFSKLLEVLTPSWAIWIDLSGRLESKGEYPYNLSVIRNGIDDPISAENIGTFVDGDKLIFAPKGRENLLYNMCELIKGGNWVPNLAGEYGKGQLKGLDIVFGVVSIQLKGDQNQAQRERGGQRVASKKGRPISESKHWQAIDTKTFSFLEGGYFKLGLIVNTKPIQIKYNNLLYGSISDELHLQLSSRAMTLYKGNLDPSAVKAFSGKDDETPFDWAIRIDIDGSLREFGRVGNHNIAFYSVSQNSDGPVRLGRKTDFKDGDLVIAISMSLKREVLVKLCDVIMGRRGRRSKAFREQIWSILGSYDGYIFGALTVSKNRN